MLGRLNENNDLEYQKLSPEEQQRRGILGRLTGIIADFKNPTRNGRRYSEALWDKTFENPIMKEKIANRCLFGELGHPADREEIDMEKIAICLAEAPKKGKDGKIYGVFDILDTPNGRILKSLCDYGCNIGVSSRGSGDTFIDMDGQESVDPDSYNCECWDAVLVPAVKEARMKMVTESLGQKTLKQALCEELEKANADDKKVMKESLDKLGISLTEEFDMDYDYAIEQLNELDLDDTAYEYYRSIIDDMCYDDKISAKNGDSGYSSIEDVLEDARNSAESMSDDDDDTLEEGAGTAAAVTAAATFVASHWDDIMKGLKDLGVTADEIDDKVVNIIKRHKELKEPKELDFNNESCENKKVEALDTTVDNVEVNVVNELQEALKHVAELENKTIELNEKLSVCYAKETKQDEELVKYKKAVSRLSEKANKVEALQEKVSKLTSEKEDINTQLNESVQKVQKLDENAHLKVRNISRLTEEIKSKDGQIHTLSESVEKLNQEKESLNAKVAELKKDLGLKKSEYSSKIEKANSIVENYKKIANKAVDKYIESEAIKLGVSVNEIKNRLPESYTFTDINSVCEELQSFKVSMNNLPFQAGLRENMKLKLTSSKNENILPAVQVNKDDEIDEALLNLAGLN